MDLTAFYFVYVLLSNKDGNFYTGYAHDLEKRFSQHQNGEVMSTKYRRPFQLIYFEACIDEADAIHREKYLKTTYGKRYLRSRLNRFLNQGT